MSSFIPSSNFHDAASYLSSASPKPNISSAIKLELYGLFKYLTVSPTPSTPRPSIIDMTARAKWDVWSLTGKTYQHRAADVENRYLEIARSFGWVEGVGQVPEENPEKNPDDGCPDAVNDESEEESSSGGMGGMGNFVSALPSTSPIEEEVQTLHGFALSDDAQGLVAYLHDNPNADINGVDKYGYTPLHLASDRGNTAVVLVLLDKGADRTLTDPDNYTASQLAHIAGHDEIQNVLENPA